MTGRQIVVSAVVLRDAAGRVLLVRKRGTARFMLPGGKPEPGETPARTAIREIAEELGATLDPDLLRPLGTFTEPAANEPGHDVVASVFAHPLVPVAGPAAEIDAVRWHEPGVPDPADLAPLSVAVFRALGI